MKTLQSIFEDVNSPIVSTEQVKVDWTNNCGKLFDWAKDNLDNYKEDIRKKVEQAMRDFYEANPRKRNIGYSSCATIEYRIPLDSMPIVDKLYRLYNEIGMGHWWYSKSYTKRLGSIECYSSLTSKFGIDDAKYEFRTNLERKPSNLQEYGNGYNNLSGEVITSFREKLLACITGANVEVREVQRSGFCLKQRDCGGLLITLTPIFAPGKLHKLYKEVLNNLDLQGYAKSMKATSDAIAAYYDSKRSGGYTGD